MIKYESIKNMESLKRTQPLASNASLLTTTSMLQTMSAAVSRRSVDPNAIDASSAKGRFAWEKIGLSDTYVPVIFRGNKKYFCVKMLGKSLPDNPENIIRRAQLYNYGKKIEIYRATPNEVELLNRINGHHSHWTYSQQPFTAATDLVNASEFLPLFEYVRSYSKSQSVPRTAKTNVSRSKPSQAEQTTLKPANAMSNMISTPRRQSVGPFTGASLATRPFESPKSTSNESSPMSRPPTSAHRPSRPPEKNKPVLGSSKKTPPQPRPQQVSVPTRTESQSIVISSSNSMNLPKTVLPKKAPADTATVLATQPVVSQPTAPLMPMISLASNYPASTSTADDTQKGSSTSSRRQSLSTSEPTCATSALSKSSSPNCGWLQINKLYTPYISTSVVNRQFYRIPVSLLTFYDLLKIPSSESNANEPRDSAMTSSFEQTQATSYEVEKINELCEKQNIKCFSSDTKLINLSTFYRYSTANILFIKELSLVEPKASICKDWSSIVQMNGGIYRLRNITRLHEQIVPFIGNHLLKIFILSSQCSSTASLTTPTAAEMEFLQLILFFTNMSVDLCNTKLIDIESVKREYNVDLILLFNDKFPLNVLNFQQQGNRVIPRQRSILSSNAHGSTNTITESTPPPSPPSPANVSTSSATSTSTVNASVQQPAASSSPASNRYQKTISFHGHTMTAYICSGLGSNAQRECVSVRELCQILDPRSSILDKLESKMLRLLRSKNINRFRPQNQQSMGFTRLVDMQDAETHWDYIEQGMQSVLANGEENVASIVDPSEKASTSDLVASNSEPIERSSPIPKVTTEVNESVKRVLEEAPELVGETGDPSVVEHLQKRPRLLETEDDLPTVVELLPETKLKNSNYDQSHEEELNIAEEDMHNSIRLESDTEEAVHVELKRIIIRQPPIRLLKRGTQLKKQTKMQKKTPETREKGSSSPKKRISLVKTRRKMARKRLKPSTRANQELMAAWVQKYKIEECWIHLDLCDPNAIMEAREVV